MSFFRLSFSLLVLAGAAFLVIGPARADYYSGYSDRFDYGGYGGYGGSDSGPIISLTLDPREELNADFRIAAREDRERDMLQLLRHKADINSQSDQGTTALMYAAQNCSQKIVSDLVEHGANVNLQDGYGRTALIFAAQESCAPVIRILLQVPELEVDHKDRAGLTAREYAVKDASLDVGGQALQAILLLTRAHSRKPRAHAVRREPRRR